MTSPASERWLYTSDILMRLAETLPPVLQTTAQLTQAIGGAAADHEKRLRDLQEHELRMKLLFNSIEAQSSAPD